ncbi:baculoviral IAP repeat-containing protein 1 [Eublepharis macularius]|uniref:Baculoviral IAP repeat-containing protein 1 n=1 Tax=Eublepharis macularius TaxID=481883 RepID=A0AA97L4Y8_EUBMA|nr:baculoviral IAP repeat-containing protein 1 [Eublepharis macularius]
MATQEAAAEDPKDSNIFELDTSYLEAHHPNVNFDFRKLAEEMEEEYRPIREQLRRGFRFNSAMRNEAQRLKTFLSQPGNSRSAWAPSEMAAAGFYHTGVKTAIQCFCCGLVVLSRSITKTPYAIHRKYQPDCEFILGKEVGSISSYEVRVQNPAKSATEIKKDYKSVEVRLESFACWPSYAQDVQPALLANAGFFFTGIKDTVQCFACNGCLGNWKDEDDPWKEHAKWFPECEFLQKEKSRDEIKAYIRNYCGFVGITGKCFSISFGNTLPPDTGDSEPILNIYEDEDVRLDSFKTWPQEAQVDATSLAKAGFFYTGMKDAVQCFACAGRLAEWEAADDPWKEHAKHFPDCKQSDPGRCRSAEQPLKQSESFCDQQIHCNNNLERTASLNSSMTNVAYEESEWLQKQLSKAYSDVNFRKMFSFGDTTHFAIDLKTLYGDLAIVSKNIHNLPLQQLILPEVLESFQSVTVIEGEAGSGKTALLRKIALLWASGCCPILSRFKFVFYLSLNSRGRDEKLADMICNHLVGLEGALTGDSLKNLCQPLTNQVLFLLDDYDEMNTVPSEIEDLIQKNHLNKHCLVIAVRTNRIGSIRLHAHLIFSIGEFPLTSTIYLLRKLFSHNIRLVEEFFIQMMQEETIQSIFKTPLFVVALGAYWTQYPVSDMFTDMIILKAYLLYISLKYPQERECMKAMVSFCGELALRGLFKSCFDFSEEDLFEVGVNGDKALWFGLLSKFTAQRLRPLYKFFHLSFQEFLAGLRLSELLSSDVQENVEKGQQYLQQINTFVKISGRYKYILVYACSKPSGAVPKIISHLLNLLSCEESLESRSENDVYLQQTPKLQLMQLELLLITLRLLPDWRHSKTTEIVLKLATELAYQSNMVPVCAPMLLKFLSGKEFSLGWFGSKGGFLSCFFQDYPESLFLPSRFVVSFTGKRELADLSLAESCYSKLGVPVVDEEYAPAFKLFSDVTKQIKEDEDVANSFKSLIPRYLPDSLVKPFVHLKDHEKVPSLKFEASNVESLNAHDLHNLVILFSGFKCIELRLQNCQGLMKTIQPAIEQNLGSFKVCSLHHNLSVIEENLLLTMSSLESLEIKKITSAPETVFANLDKFIFLKELSVDLSDCQNIFDIIPEGFKNLHSIEKLLLYNVKFQSGSARLVEFMWNSPNLSVFHLQHSDFSEFGALMDAISPCKTLTEIRLTGLSFGDKDLFSLAAALPNFAALKVLDLARLEFTDEEACTAFALALGCLVTLEELVLPIGEGVSHVAKAIVQQCIHIPNLQKLEFNQSLSDEGLLEIANVAVHGGFQKLEFLLLLANHTTTESAWRTFFQILPDMPKLQKVDFSRIFTHPIKCEAATVRSFVQSVSRQPSLTTISMIGWLFDEEDIKMFDVMKEHHPQSKSLNLTWKFMLPFSPIVQE